MTLGSLSADDLVCVPILLIVWHEACSTRCYRQLGGTRSWIWMELGLGFGWRPLWELSLINSPWGQESFVQCPGLSASTLEAQARLPVRESIPHKPFIMVIKGIKKKKKPRQMLKQLKSRNKSKANKSMCMHVCVCTCTHTHTHIHKKPKQNQESRVKDSNQTNKGNPK